MNFEQFFSAKLMINDRVEVVESGKMAKFADGAIFYKVGKSAILATVVSEKKPSGDENFLPLTVQYIEKAYAAGKFPGGFLKREGKPSDYETLTSRLIDRSLRPLFPKGYHYPTQITVTVLSCDESADLQQLALNAASAALFVSDLPVEKFVAGVRVGKKDGSFVVNPTVEGLKASPLDLFVAGTEDEVLMIEMGANSTMNLGFAPVGIPLLDMNISESAFSEQLTNEMGEDELLDAIKFASSAISESSKSFIEALSQIKKPTRSYELKTEQLKTELYEFIKTNYSDNVKTAIRELSKSERSAALEAVIEQIKQEKFVIDAGFSGADVEFAAEKRKKEILRGMILNEQIRPDGRGLKDIRPIAIETNLLPSAHGSALFTRGQTQALGVATIGGEMDKQGFENLTDKGSRSENFMLHYNFPSFSVGEAERVGAPGRRELGHGNLAKKAIEPLLRQDYTSALRVVSEILESNGSSSMATVCAAALAIKAANVPLIKLAAGIAMGLVMENGKYVILSDIIGLEDYDGDMDFKVAGTKDGVTALQMDIKLGGLNFELLKDTLYQAKEGRLAILSKMEAAASEITVNYDALPRVEIFHIDASKIVDIIGQAGKTIKEIIEKFEVAIDLDREKGQVKVIGKNKEKVEGAKEHILGIAANSSGGGGRRQPQPKCDYKEGDEMTGKVKSITSFGAFLLLPNGSDGLLHISKISKKRINRVEEFLNLGDEAEVLVIGFTKGRPDLALKEPRG